MGAARGSGGSVGAGCSEAGGDWGARSRGADGAGESSRGEHFGGEGRWGADGGGAWDGRVGCELRFFPGLGEGALGYFGMVRVSGSELWMAFVVRGLYDF